MKLLLIFMFFFMLVSCEANYINVEPVNKTIIKEDTEYFEIPIKTNLSNLSLLKVENNDFFEYELIENDTGYLLKLTIYNPKNFKTITFKNNKDVYDILIGEVNLIKLVRAPANYINLIVENNEVYIYNKTDQTIVIKEIKVFGGDFLEKIKYYDLIYSKDLKYIGNIYKKTDEYVVYIKYRYGDELFEQVFEIK